jgi:membrane-bound lytic murein transglycosylase D
VTQVGDRHPLTGHNRALSALTFSSFREAIFVIEKRICWWALILCWAAAAAFADGGSDAFPRPKQLEAAVKFWMRVYTEVDTHGGFIHDPENLSVVYEKIRSSSENPSARRREVERAVAHYREILTKLGTGVREGLSQEERRVLDLWPKGTSNAELKRAAGRIRFQLGQADRFRAGIVRSGVWRPYIEQVLAANGLPPELAALPHVESSFDPTAYSKVGAAGLWQFTRSTGVRYMRIDRVVDERRDPFLSTNAAARLLRDNYDVLQSWPLAITAYNHGQAGMRRAVSVLHTTDIGVIVDKYDSRTFGFASRNFYAAFLAAVDIDAAPEKYFGKVALRAPLDTLVTPVPDYMKAETLARALKVDFGRLRELNPALTDAVWGGEKLVPKDFPLRLPGRAERIDANTLLAAVPASERYASQTPDVQHRVRRGETLSQIAAQYRVSLASLIRINGLRSGNLIRAGQVLALPLPGGTTPPTLAETRGGALLARAEQDDSAAGSSTRASAAAAGADALASGRYVVRRGDSLDRIAKTFGVGVDDLLAANDLRDKNLIIAGQTLRLPGSVLAARNDSGDGAADDRIPDDGSLGGDALSVETETSSESAAAIAVAAVARDAGAAAPADAVAAAGDARIEPIPVATVASLTPAPSALDAGGGRGDAEAESDAFGDEAGVIIGADVPAEGAAGAESDEDGASDDAASAAGNEEASLDSNALASNQAELAADPSDYSVSADGTITVQSLETLGHYADWLEIRTQHLRDLNRLPFRQAVVIGQALKLDFSRVSPAEFEQRRVAYHRAQQEAFFSRYRIATIEDHVIRRGESLWVLTRRDFGVPVWLLRQYNPDLDLDHVAPGAVVKFPKLVPIDDGDGTQDSEPAPEGVV